MTRFGLVIDVSCDSDDLRADDVLDRVMVELLRRRIGRRVPAGDQMVLIPPEGGALLVHYYVIDTTGEAEAALALALAEDALLDDAPRRVGDRPRSR